MTEIRKIHTGLPGLIVDMLTAVVLADIGEFDISKGLDKEITLLYSYLKTVRNPSVLTGIDGMVISVFW